MGSTFPNREVSPFFYKIGGDNMSLSNEAVANGKELAQQNISLKDGACLLGWQLRSPCGESTLPNARIELDGQKVSSDQIKGSKLQWFPKSKLKLTTKYNNRLTRTFNSYGVKYGDFTVVPTARLDELNRELEAIKRDWQDEVTALMADYDHSITQHMDANIDIAALIKKYALSKLEFESKFKLTFTKPLAMKALFVEDEDGINEDVADSLWQEIAKEASTVYKVNWFKDKRPVSRVSQKVRSPFRRMMNKLVDLSFVDEGIENVVTTIQEVLKNLPTSGYIEGHALSELTNWLLVMSNEDTLRLHAEGNSQYSATPEPEVITQEEHSETDLVDVGFNVDASQPATQHESSVENTPEPVVAEQQPSIANESERSNSLNGFGFEW